MGPFKSIEFRLRQNRHAIVAAYCMSTLFADSVRSEDVKEIYRLPAGRARLASYDLSSSGRYLVTLPHLAVPSTEQPVYLDDVHAKRELNVLRPGTHHVQVSDNGRTVVSCYLSGVIWTRSVSGAMMLSAISLTNVYSLSVSADGTSLAYVSGGDKAGAYIRRLGEPTAIPLEYRKVWGFDDDIQFSAGGKCVAVVTSGKLVVFGAQTGKVSMAVSLPAHYPRGAVAISDDGAMCAVGLIATGDVESRRFCIWDATEGKLLADIYDSDPWTEPKPTLSHDKKWMAVRRGSGVGGGIIRIYNVNSGTLTYELRESDIKGDSPGYWIPSIAFSPSDKEIVFASADGVVRSWAFLK